MSTYKSPSKNCPTCCPQKYCSASSAVVPIKFSNGQLPINFQKRKFPENIQGPRRFSGKYNWQNRQFRRFHVPEGITFNKNPIQSWSGGPGDTLKSDMALEFGSISEIAESGMALFKNQWTASCAEVGAAVKYLRHLWMTTNGNYSQKALVVNRMICFYLILLGIYIAESAFWVNQQLLEGLCGVVLKPKRNVDMLMGFGAVAVFIFLLYLTGAPSESQGVCTIPRD